MTTEVRDWWEARSESFQAEADIDVTVNWMGLGYGDLNLLGDVTGLDILELGCGGGQCTVALAERGATLTGLDISAEQLAHAQQLATDHDVDIELVQGDVTDLGFDTGSYDIAFNAWVFQWVGDLESCFGETYRVLRPGGRFVFSMPHPFYELADPDTHEITESYFDTGRYVIASEDLNPDQVMFRHTVSGIYSALVDAGFTVECLREPGTSSPEDYEAGPWGELTPGLMSKLPVVLAVEARKPAVQSGRKEKIR